MSRLIVFDLDGTLVDSRRDLANATNALLVECGAAPLAEERVGQMVGDGAATLIARAFDASGLVPPRDALERFLRIYGEHLLDYTRPYAGVPEALTTLKERAQLAVLTNKPLASTERILEGLDLRRFFSDGFVVGGDGPLPRKPDPTALHHLIARAGVANEHALLVGDSSVDWRTARAASVNVALVRYGFGFASVPLDQLGQDARIVDAPDDFVRL